MKIRKKLYLVCLMLTIMFGVAACDEKGEFNEVNNKENADDTSEYVFIYNLFEISIGDKWENVVVRLGDYNESFVAESCAYQGTDRYYYYDGFEVMTSEIDGEELLTDIFIEGSDIKAVNDVCVGMSLSDMANAMGAADTSKGNAFIYYGGNVNVQINTKDSKVASIEYYYVQE